MSLSSLFRFQPRTARRVALKILPFGALLVLSGPSAAAVTIEYVYDDLNRLERFDRTDGALVVYQYDTVSNIDSIVISNRPDFDGDGIADFADPDDDNDGIPDDVEIAAGLNPFNALDAGLDLDGDGISNLDEYLQGSDINHYHGDLDGDGDLDLGDIVVLQRIIFEEVPPMPGQEEPGHGDVNLDGKLDVGDLVILRQRYFDN